MDTSHVREVLLFHLLHFNNPFEARPVGDRREQWLRPGRTQSRLVRREKTYTVYIYTYTWRATKSIRKGEEESPLPRQKR